MIARPGRGNPRRAKGARIDTPRHGEYLPWAVQLPAPVAVPVEIELLDAGPRAERIWRLARAIGEQGVGLVGPLPWEAGRPVRATLVLPDQDAAVTAVGAVAPEAAIAFGRLEPDARARLIRYVEERMTSP
jgi:hypothetical protein